MIMTTSVVIFTPLTLTLSHKERKYRGKLRRGSKRYRLMQPAIDLNEIVFAKRARGLF